MSHNCLMSHLHRLINIRSFLNHSPSLCALLLGLDKRAVSRSHLAQISHFIPFMLSLTPGTHWIDHTNWCGKRYWPQCSWKSLVLNFTVSFLLDAKGVLISFGLRLLHKQTLKFSCFKAHIPPKSACRSAVKV